VLQAPPRGLHPRPSGAAHCGFARVNAAGPKSLRRERRNLVQARAENGVSVKSHKGPFLRQVMQWYQVTGEVGGRDEIVERDSDRLIKAAERGRVEQQDDPGGVAAMAR
jgi:hypothetical protein